MDAATDAPGLAGAEAAEAGADEAKPSGGFSFNQTTEGEASDQ